MRTCWLAAVPAVVLVALLLDAPRRCRSGLWLALLVASLGCGGSVPNQSSPAAETRRAVTSAEPRDIEIVVAEPVSVTARPLAPALSPWPRLPESSLSAARRRTLERREARKRRMPERDAAELALALLRDADVSTAAREKRLRRALELLREITKRSARQARTNELHAYVEAVVGSCERALGIAAELRERSELSAFGTAVVAACALRDGGGDAVQALLGQVLPGDVDPVVPYARAWLRFRDGDRRGAFIDMSHAARAWRGQRPDALLEELAVMAAHARVPATELRGHLDALDGVSMPRRYLLRAYRRVGAYELTIELARALPPSRQLPPAKRGIRKRRRSDLHYQLGQPAAAAENMQSALEEVIACGQPCSERVERMVQRALDMARFFHTVYTVARDPSYFEPARILYQSLASRRGEVQQLISDLEHLKLRDGSGAAGTHSAEVLAPFAAARIDAIRGCYAAGLAAQPELLGSLTLRWAIAASGEVEGVESSPPGGEEGIAAVARCAVESSRGWRFPARSVPGQTRLTVRYELGRELESR